MPTRRRWKTSRSRRWAGHTCLWLLVILETTRCTKKNNEAQNQAAEDRAAVERTFVQHYEDNVWEDPSSRSGPGSNLAHTVATRQELARLIKDYNISSIFDAACGDFVWMQHVDLSKISYTGRDIVPQLIAKNQHDYGTEDGRIRFEHGDITTDAIPRVDLVIVRDVLIHQNLGRAQKTLRNIAKSGSKWALISTHPEQPENFEINDGAFTLRNLERPPFNLPKPTRLIKEESDRELRAMGLWPVSAIR